MHQKWYLATVLSGLLTTDSNTSLFDAIHYKYSQYREAGLWYQPIYLDKNNSFEPSVTMASGWNGGISNETLNSLDPFYFSSGINWEFNLLL